MTLMEIFGQKDVPINARELAPMEIVGVPAGRIVQKKKKSIIRLAVKFCAPVSMLEMKSPCFSAHWLSAHHWLTAHRFHYYEFEH